MTYSIVARDPATGALGVAVQSGTFGVGAIVPWARAGAALETLVRSFAAKGLLVLPPGTSLDALLA
jgi:uncharacterized Ntn-hydrolase superfamily protein